MMETLLGSLMGGVFRVVPEVLSIVDKKNERKHEKDMFQHQLEADKLKIQQAEITAKNTLDVEEVKALVAGIQAQAVQTGIKWVDAVSSLMRPLITFWWVLFLYTVSMLAQYVALWGNGVDWYNAIALVFGADEKAIAASIISYWFLDRSLRKK